jgi:trans-aconitate 2-methyltransferase
MPRNFEAPSHTLVTDTVRGGPWFAKLSHLLKPPPVGEPTFYYDLLAPLAVSVDLWEVDYVQVLSGENPVKEWTCERLSVSA